MGSTEQADRRWFPKPEGCTCTYDSGFIYDDPKCPVHGPCIQGYDKDKCAGYYSCGRCQVENT